jgi:UDP-glucose:tetrahydrobiopterin glucosyltransferase
MRIAMVSTSVGPLGTGIGGGVDLTVTVIGRALRSRGHSITIFAPTGSKLEDFNIVQCDGAWQFPAQGAQRQSSIDMPNRPVLGSMWSKLAQHGDQFDVVLNFAFDWLPLWWGTTTTLPVGHLISMGSMNDTVDSAALDAMAYRPGSVAMHTMSQVNTFTSLPRNEIVILGNGIEVERYRTFPEHSDRLVWVGRIAPEKGLADSAEVARRCGKQLVVYGLDEHPDLLAEAREICHLDYGGFVSTAELANCLGDHSALLMTHKWDEAFGNVVVEALACGLPVIAYERGGPAELIDDGLTGLLVPADDIDAMVSAVRALDMIDRATCRDVAMQRFSADAMGERVEQWLAQLIATAPVVW